MNGNNGKHSESLSEDSEEDNPDLFFDHIGHVSKITDFAWSESSPWTMVSVSADLD